MLVIADDFLRSSSSPSRFNCSWTTLSITRTDLVWIWNLLVPKETDSVPFLQALENWNGSISNKRSSNLDQIDPDRSDRNVEMESKKVQKDEKAAAKLHNLIEDSNLKTNVNLLFAYLLQNDMTSCPLPLPTSVSLFN